MHPDASAYNLINNCDFTKYEIIKEQNTQLLYNTRPTDYSHKNTKSLEEENPEPEKTGPATIDDLSEAAASLILEGARYDA
jgi:hypothetical protein